MFGANDLAVWAVTWWRNMNWIIEPLLYVSPLQSVKILGWGNSTQNFNMAKNKKVKIPLNSFAKVDRINIPFAHGCCSWKEQAAWGSFTACCVIAMSCACPLLQESVYYMKQAGRINGCTKKLRSGNGLIICKCYFTFSDSSTSLTQGTLRRTNT